MKWSEEEIEILKKEYSKINGKNVTNVLEKLSKQLGRSKNSIRNKAYYLGITHKEKFYTDKEIMFLKENINKMTYDDIAIKLGKDKSNVCRKCKQLGIEKENKCNSKLIEVKSKYKFTEEDIKKAVETNKKKYEKGLHPKGYLGHKHSNETLEKLSQKSKNKWETITPEELEERKIKARKTKIANGTLNPMNNQKNPYSRAKGGKRKDLNDIYFRSSWEANIARYYNFIGVKWEFEPKTFVFKDIKRGSVSYTPDFYLPEEDRWIEVKGWMDGKSKTKLKRFKNQYPEEYKKLTLITEKEYKEIERKMAPFIKNWE